jgi:hypothetical protein
MGNCTRKELSGDEETQENKKIEDINIEELRSKIVSNIINI